VHRLPSMRHTWRTASLRTFPKRIAAEVPLSTAWCCWSRRYARRSCYGEGTATFLSDKGHAVTMSPCVRLISACCMDLHPLSCRFALQGASRLRVQQRLGSKQDGIPVITV
jgi:hypothetical protein